jgi:hypothetical protein
MLKSVDHVLIEQANVEEPFLRVKTPCTHAVWIKGDVTTYFHWACGIRRAVVGKGQVVELTVRCHLDVLGDSLLRPEEHVILKEEDPVASLPQKCFAQTVLSVSNPVIVGGI